MGKLRIFLAAVLLVAAISAGAADEIPSDKRYTVEKQPLFTIDKKLHLYNVVLSTDRKKVALVCGKNQKFYVWTESRGKTETFQQIPRVNFSPAGSRIAWLGDRKDGIYVYVDGVKHGPYAGLAADSVVFSPDESSYAFITGRGRPHRSFKDFTVVIDGKESPRYKHMFTSLPQFSPDSRKAVYFAGDDKHWFSVVNGIEGPKFDKTGNGPVFSPDGSLMAYTGFMNDSVYVVVNDSIHGGFWEFQEMHFSPTSNDLVYCARKDTAGTFQIYFNHQPVEGWHASQWPVFSPHGERLAFWASDSLGQHAVVDSFVSDAHPYVLRLYFSPGGEHFYYTWSPELSKDGIMSVTYVVDGKEFPTMTGALQRPSRYWSPDDSRFAYAWDITDKEDAICIDGVVDSGYILLGDVVFSPDSKRWAYLGQKKGDEGVRLYLDGKVITREASIGANVVFSPDSRDVAYFVTSPDKKRYLVINDTEYEHFQNVFPTKVAFSDDGSITYYALQDNTVYRVTVRPAEMDSR
ncbi:MAG: PD40 domain-containing protein [Candidatus Zixiibacteriota bacterium]|nr:MAG: PD40 domain-containing protein [candidate division Zixibacteria bacterium]